MNNRSIAFALGLLLVVTNAPGRAASDNPARGVAVATVFDGMANAVAYSDAIVLDLRRNHGGDPKVVPGPRITAPLYVLTSAETFSGGEECAYDVQSLKRATLVGALTGGGANPGRSRRIDDHFSIFVPTMRAQNPVTKTNWEGVGVKPDVTVAASWTP